ncbi:mitochondrial assembly of ribosomal large subunit protein 1 [Antennarius striatus]|uniref:mitochondrial assembly of ribosomal large subunit protein 1 n=1 Tax=Antennarius striatus TaxID=241820 RepID=UPI0035B035FC
MQIIPYCLKKLVSPVFKSSVIVKQSGVFRNLCSIPKSRFNLNLPRRAHLSSSQSWCVGNSHVDTQRWYSEVCTDGEQKRSAGVEQEKSQEIDSVHKQTKFTLDVLVSLLRQENAVDICVIRVPEQIKYAEYFIVVSGISVRHLRAMAFYTVKVYKFLKKKGEPNVKIEGKDAEDWICIDFGNMVVHFMLPETREVYELEKLWTLRSYDEQLKNIPAETLPKDFIYDIEDTK